MVISSTLGRTAAASVGVSSAPLREVVELIERLAVLVPRGHLLVYHGLLAPNAALRARVVPVHPAPEPPADQCPGSATKCEDQVEDFPRGGTRGSPGRSY